MKQYVTAKEAIFLTEHAIDRIRNSEEYKDIMEELNEKLLKAAESGAKKLYINLDVIQIPDKFNQKMIIENLVSDWQDLGFKVSVYFTEKEHAMIISWYD